VSVERDDLSPSRTDEPDERAADTARVAEIAIGLKEFDTAESALLLALGQVRQSRSQKDEKQS